MNPRLVVSSFCFALTLASPVAFADEPLAKGETVTISINGNTKANGVSLHSSLSANGRFVVFESEASNLAEQYGNGASQIVLRDRKTGATTLASRNGENCADTECDSSVISANGRYVAYRSMAGNITNPTNGKFQVFRYDRVTGTTIRVSQNEIGAGANQDCDHNSVDISANGRFVVFATAATNLIAAGGNGFSQVLRRDLKTGEFVVVSIGTTGALGNKESGWARISKNGRYVAFQSLASNVAAGPVDATFDVFLRDTKKLKTRRVSRPADFSPANGESYFPVLSDNGRYVAFISYASNIVPKPADGVSELYVWDRKTEEVQYFPYEFEWNRGRAAGMSISRNGNRIVCEMLNENQAINPFDDYFTTLLLMRKTGKFTPVIVNKGGQVEKSSTPNYPAISGNGKFVSFTSVSDAIGVDADQQADVFLKRP